MADPSPDRDIRPRRARNLLLVVAGVVLAFLLGFGWQWMEARGYRNELDETRRELEFQRMATTLATAVVQADRGSYEGAREGASRFFTSLQENLDRAEPEAQADLREILARRDAIITSLSRSEPGAAEVLAQTYVRYGVATGGEEVGLAVPAGRLQAPAGGEGAPGTAGDSGTGTAPGGP